jgi:hypothetical protein
MKKITQTVNLIDLTQEPFDLVNITLRLPEQLIEKLRTISLMEGLSPSGWLEKMVNEYRPYFGIQPKKGSKK